MVNKHEEKIKEMENEIGKKIGVTIICMTYNHEKYIGQALNGFIAQETTFPIEIIIHDDASSDGTRKIIEDYKLKYPDIINTILQKENQYSQGKNIFLDYIYPLVKGKYIALCEGDDYWIDPHKIQKQYECLEQNEGIDMCAHAVKVVWEDSKKTKKVLRSKNTRIFTLKETIEGGGNFFATNTLMYRSKLASELPDFVKEYSIDYALQIQGAMRGGIFYMPQIMAVYRSGVQGSWTEHMKKSEKYRNDEEDKLKEMLHLVDIETDGKYSQLIREVFLEAQYSDMYFAGQYGKLRDEKFKQIYKKKSLWHRFKVLLKQKYMMLM